MAGLISSVAGGAFARSRAAAPTWGAPGPVLDMLDRDRRGSRAGPGSTTPSQRHHPDGLRSSHLQRCATRRADVLKANRGTLPATPAGWPSHRGRGRGHSPDAAQAEARPPSRHHVRVYTALILEALEVPRSAFPHCCRSKQGRAGARTSVRDGEGFSAPQSSAHSPKYVGPPATAITPLGVTAPRAATRTGPA